MRHAFQTVLEAWAGDQLLLRPGADAEEVGQAFEGVEAHYITQVMWDHPDFRICEVEHCYHMGPREEMLVDDTEGEEVCICPKHQRPPAPEPVPQVIDARREVKDWECQKCLTLTYSKSAPVRCDHCGCPDFKEVPEE